MKRLALALMLIFTVFSTAAYAVPISVSSRAALGGYDFFDWGDLGPDGTAVSNPFNLASNLGLYTATVSIPSGSFTRMQEGSTNWKGNFAAGDALLWTGQLDGSGFPTIFHSGPMTIAFDSPVYGVGAQIQGNRNFWQYTASIKAFDGSDSLIGSYSVVHTSTQAGGGNTAPFLGLLDTVPSIYKIEFDVVYDAGCTIDCESFAINQLDVAVPEPATLLLLGSGLMGLGLWRRRKRIII